MENNPLKIVSIDRKPTEATSLINNRKHRRDEIQARMDRLWNQNPEQFNPLRNCTERDRLDRTSILIQDFLPLSEKTVVDLGCGEGEFSRRMRDGGASVHAVDVSTIPLSKVKKIENIIPIQDCLPNTELKNDAYDLVVCNEVIAYLNIEDYRLFFAELSRIVKPQGFVVCSTALDVGTNDPLDKFARLAETEFEISKWTLSHHLLHIRFCDFFEAPSRFIKACHDSAYRHKQIEDRKGLSRLWFQWNSSPALAFFWYPFQFLFKPAVTLLKQNRSLMLFMEKMTRFLWNESGISHAIFIGKRRPLVHPLPPNEVPREIKHKKQVWE